MASDQQFCLRWNNHQNTLVSILDSLLDSGTLVDCTLAAEGRFLQAHKVVLSACSPYFAMLLREHYDKFPILILKDIKYQELQAMMNYMYRGEVNITQETLGSFLKAAESLQIRGLTDNSSSGGGGSSSSSSNSSNNNNNHHHHHNNHCGVENNNGMVRDSSATTHPYHGSGGCNSILNKKIPDPRKLVVAPHTPPLLSQQPSPLPPQLQQQQQQSQQQQQRSRSPQAASLLPQPQPQSHKKYLKSPAAAVVAGILENHHSGGPVAAAVASKSSCAASASEPSSLDTSSCSSSSTKRRKLLPPIKSESLVVTPINPAAAAAVAVASGYNSLGAADSPNEVPSQQLQPCAAAAVAASEGKPVNMVGSPSMPPKVESPRMDVSPVAAVVPTKGLAEPLIKAKPLGELVKVKSEQLDDSYNEDTNDDSLTTEENCDIDRDENSQLGGSLPFPNSQSGQNFENLERSLVSQDGSLQDTSDARAADEIVSQFVIKLSDSMPIDYCLATTLCEPSLSTAAVAAASSTPTSTTTAPSTAATSPTPSPATAPTAAANSMTLTMTFAATTLASHAATTVAPSGGAATAWSAQSLLQPLAAPASGLHSLAAAPGVTAAPPAQSKVAQSQQPKAFFPCDSCGNVYNYKTSLARHVRFECGKDPQFKCPFCEHRTKHKSSLTTHIDCKHRQELLFDENRYWREFYALTKTQ